MLRELNFLVHTGHDYERCKLGHRITYIVSNSLHGRLWSLSQRPKPENIEFIFPENVSLRDYDVVVVHDNVQLDWIYRLFARTGISKPVIQIMHSSPINTATAKWFQDKLLSLNAYVIFNSFKDQKLWSIKGVKQKVIIAGLDPDEWGPWEGGSGQILHVGNNLTSRDWVTGYSILKKATKDLPLKIVGHNPDLKTKVAPNFDALREEYRKCSVYFNPTKESPNPRGRIEAAMTGCPLVSTEFVDADFIKNGVNGYKSNDPTKLREYLIDLLNNEEKQKVFSKRIRETAIEKFHIKRFLKEWKEVLEEVIN